MACHFTGCTWFLRRSPHMHCIHVIMDPGEEGEEREGVQPRKRRARHSPPFVLADHFDNGWCIHCERQAKLALLPTARRSTYITAKVCVAGWFWHMDGATRLLATLRSASRGALSFADATCSATFNVRLPMLCVCLPPGLAAMSRPPGVTMTPPSFRTEEVEEARAISLPMRRKKRRRRTAKVGGW